MQASSVSIPTQKKHSLGTAIKMKLFDNFHHIIENPPKEDLKQLDQSEKFSFKFNNSQIITLYRTRVK